MGWDTQINIIVENIINEEKVIATDLFLTDAKSYWGNGLFFAKHKSDSNGNRILFFSYLRRKVIPYWTIQEVSKKYPEQYFTALGSSPDFLCGPAGIIKIKNGEIIDSYGFFEQRQEILSNPNPEILFQWFGKNKCEEKFRNLYIEQKPRKWIEGNYCENLINFSKNQNEKLNEIINLFGKLNLKWLEIKLNSTKPVLKANLKSLEKLKKSTNKNIEPKESFSKLIEEYKPLKKIISSHYIYSKKIDLINIGYELGYRDDYIIEKYIIVSNLETIINEFTSGIEQRLNSFSFSFEKWIFIPETFHYYLYDLESGETYNQTVWFRENKRNYQDSNIGNYFESNKHITINRKSVVIFDLNNKKKQVIKPKFVDEDINWVKLLDKNTIQLIFKNKTIDYNFEN